MVYAGDLKSPTRKGVRVRVPPPVLHVPLTFLFGLSSMGKNLEEARALPLAETRECWDRYPASPLP